MDRCGKDVSCSHLPETLNEAGQVTQGSQRSQLPEKVAPGKKPGGTVVHRRARKELPEKQLEASAAGRRTLSALAILGQGVLVGESRQGHRFCRPVDPVGPDLILKIIAEG